MIDLAALEKALAPIRELGRKEFPLMVSGTELVLMPLDPDAERAVQAWARAVLQDESGKERDSSTHADMLEYLDRFKLGVLSHAIVQIGDIDLRDVEYILTGETTEEGKPIKKQKHLLLRELLVKQFSRPVLLSVFKAYGDLMARVELDTEKAVQYDMVDLESEIERVRERLQELEQYRDAQKRPAEDSMSNQIKTAADHASTIQEANRTLANGDQKRADVFLDDEAEPLPTHPRSPEPPPPTPEPVQALPEPPEAVRAARARSGAREPVSPQSAPAPSRREPEVERPPEHPRAKDPTDHIMDSFADPTVDALAAENQRLMGQRNKAKVEAATAVTPARPRRSPPHRQASNVEDAVVDTGGDQLRRAQRVGTVDGVEAYRLPGVELSHRGGEKPPIDIKKARVNEPGGGGEVNAKFKPQRR